LAAPHRPDPPSHNALGKRLAFDQLHDKGLNVIRLLKPVDVRNIRMVECREDLRLSSEQFSKTATYGKYV
jgi:hypothetical protein